MTTETTEKAEAAQKPTTTKARNGRSAKTKAQTPVVPEEPQGPRGRFSAEQRARILEQAQGLVDAGSSWTAAAEAVGVRPDTVRRWRQPGEAEQSPAQRIK